MGKETQIYSLISLWLKSCPSRGIPYIVWAIFKCIFKQYCWTVTHAYTLSTQLPGFYHRHMWTLAGKMKAVIIYFSVPASWFDSLHNNTLGGQLTFFCFLRSEISFKPYNQNDLFSPPISKSLLKYIFKVLILALFEFHMRLWKPRGWVYCFSNGPDTWMPIHSQFFCCSFLTDLSHSQPRAPLDTYPTPRAGLSVLNMILPSTDSGLSSLHDPCQWDKKDV